MVARTGGGVCEPPPIPDQALLRRLRDERVNAGLMPLHAQARPNLHQPTGHRQVTLQGEIQQAPTGDIDLGGRPHLPIRQMVMELPKGQLAHAPRIVGGAPHRWPVAVGDAGTTPRHVDVRLDPPPVVVWGHQLLIDQRLHLGRCGVVALFPHAMPPSRVESDLLDLRAFSNNFLSTLKGGQGGLLLATAHTGVPMLCGAI